MSVAFELKSLNTALDRLVKDGVITPPQRIKLYALYANDTRPYKEIHEELNKVRYDDKLLEKLMLKNETVAGKKINAEDVKKTPKVTLSLDNVTDFEKDGKYYIKIHYPYPYDNVRIIENLSDPYHSGRERFTQLCGNQSLISLDGEKTATTIFEESLVRDCHEINIRALNELENESEFRKLNVEEQRRVLATKKVMASNPDAFLQKQVFIAPAENIVVVLTPNAPRKDEVKTVKETTVNGVVKQFLVPLNETGYRYDGKNNEQRESPSESSLATDTANEEYEKSDGEELGTAYKKLPKNKRKGKEAAFINTLLLVIILGLITGLIITLLAGKTYY